MRNSDSNLINNKKYVVLFVVIFCLGLLVSAGTYALWTWTSNTNKNVVFNVVNGFEQYITYNEGNSHFVGNFQPYDSFCESISTTLSFSRYEEPIDVNFYATVKMDVNSIGDNISNSDDVYWVLTSGNDTITCSDGLDSSYVISYGRFNGINVGDTIVLKENIDVTTTEQTFTVWIWIDSFGSDLSNLSGEIIDANVWTEFTMTEGSEVKFDDHTLMITSYTCNYGKENEVTVGDNPYFTYTGQCEVIDDGNGDWRIKFLTDGEFTSKLNIPIDVFLVGGGGGGGNVYQYGGGGGGYTTTTFANVKSGTVYSIDVGDGGPSGTDGENTTAFNSIAFGGKAGTQVGGTGGSGGGGYGGNGGSDGSDGLSGSTATGLGQESTTREFGESTGTLYSGGGGGGGGSVGLGGEGGGMNGKITGITLGESNTGGGGGGSSDGGAHAGGDGGSGIVVIRNTRINLSDVSKLPTVAFDFTYTGEYVIVNEGSGNWKIKFLTDGEFKSTSNLNIDAFLVGGGGGGGANYNYGGGGGGYTTTTFVNVKSETVYSIDIGAGGPSGTDGENTIAFNSIAFGGKTGTQVGGTGGSGGGGYGGNGGSDGSDGLSGSTATGGGQESTTREFGESTGKLYAGGGGGGGEVIGLGGDGGGGYGKNMGTTSAVANLGGGGGGSSDGGAHAGGDGGSGIVVIRNTRINLSDVSKLPTVAFDFTYTGDYVIVSEGSGNWKIKFLTDGEFKSTSNLNIDAFLVGGGGGGGANYNYGGGGGGYTNMDSVSVSANTNYILDIGRGGASATNGENTTGFGLTANGGLKGGYSNGGDGGSGGGGSNGEGGSDGSDGAAGSGGSGNGQNTTTREFGESTGKLYAGGGGGGGADIGLGGDGGGGNGKNMGDTYAAANLGGGGGGSSNDGTHAGGEGGSGILIIRNKR